MNLTLREWFRILREHHHWGWWQAVRWAVWLRGWL